MATMRNMDLSWHVSVIGIHKTIEILNRAKDSTESLSKAIKAIKDLRTQRALARYRKKRAPKGLKRK